MLALTAVINGAMTGVNTNVCNVKIYNHLPVVSNHHGTGTATGVEWGAAFTYSFRRNLSRRERATELWLWDREER
jgi:hypothetical protein